MGSLTLGRSLALGEGAGGEGTPGAPGAPGKSSYQLALDAGFVGTLAQYLDSLRSTVPGPDGDDGAPGAPGLSAYQIVTAAGFVGSEADWVASLKGTTGDDGIPGKSAYELARDEGFVGTQTQWLASLKGEPGTPGSGGGGSPEFPPIKFFNGDIPSVSQPDNENLYARTFPTPDYPEQLLYGRDTGLFYTWSNGPVFYYDPQTDSQKTAVLYTWVTRMPEFEAGYYQLSNYSDIPRSAADNAINGNPIPFQYGPAIDDPDISWDVNNPGYVIFNSEKTFNVYLSFEVPSGGGAGDWIETHLDTGYLDENGVRQWNRQIYYLEKLIDRAPRIGDRISAVVGTVRPRLGFFGFPPKIEPVRLSFYYRSGVAATLKCTMVSFRELPQWSDLR